MKTRDEILIEIKGIIATSLNIPIETITEDSRIEELSVDSIQLFELLLAFEKAYTIETTYEDVVQLHTVRDIVDYAERTVYKV